MSRFCAVHELVEHRGAFVTGAPLVVFDGGDRHGLVLADETVAADSEDGDIFRHGETGGETGAESPCRVCIVVSEQSEGLWRGAQLVAEPVVEPGKVVQPLRWRFFRKYPLEWLRVDG